MRPNKQTVPSQNIDLDLELDRAAQHLLAPLGTPKAKESPKVEYSLDDTSEIELTADQMDDLLAGRWQP